MPDNQPIYVLEAAVEVKPKDQDKLRRMLEDATRSDTSLCVDIDQVTGQAVLKVTDEQVLQDIINRLKHEFADELRIGTLQPGYRETISAPVKIDHTYKKQIGGGGEFACVRILFEPLSSGSGFLFVASAATDAVPEKFIPAIERGLEEQRKCGLVAGFPVIDFKATLTGGAYHEIDSNSHTFEIAARGAFRELALRGGIKLLEPVMKIDVITPGDYVGGVIGDLNSRRSKVIRCEARNDVEIHIEAFAPISVLIGYRTFLNTITAGRAHCFMNFDHFETVPNGGGDPKFPGAAAARIA